MSFLQKLGTRLVPYRMMRLMPHHIRAASTFYSRRGTFIQGRSLTRRAADVQAALTVLGRVERKAGSIVVDLRASELRGADLPGADLTGADLGVADLGSTDLRGAALSGAKLVGADLAYAALEGADLAGADFFGAHLESTDLALARLRGADISGVDLAGATLFGADLTGAFADHYTRWPDGFDPEAAGVIFVDREESLYNGETDAEQ